MTLTTNPDNFFIICKQNSSSFYPLKGLMSFIKKSFLIAIDANAESQVLLLKEVLIGWKWLPIKSTLQSEGMHFLT